MTPPAHRRCKFCRQPNRKAAPPAPWRAGAHRIPAVHFPLSQRSFPSTSPAKWSTPAYMRWRRANASTMPWPAAGGATSNADLNRVNMAEYLTDAAKYQIPGSSGDAPVSAAPHAAQPGNALSYWRQRPRAATRSTSTRQPRCAWKPCPASERCGRGKLWRTGIRSGPFGSTHGITDVAGIGDGIYGRIAGMITVSSP